MADKLDQIKKIRLAKIEDLKLHHLDPYPQPNLKNRNTCQEASKLTKGKVTLAGRLMSLRGHGKVFFADLKDFSGSIQLFFQQSNLKDFKKAQKLLDIGDIVSVKGSLFTTKSGQITVDVDHYQLLSKSIRPLPEKWHGFKDVEERYRQRYVDLIVNHDVMDIFLTRSKILTSLREFLDKSGFIEVETPILQPIYGGASAKPFVTHHNTLDMDMYLRISDELYLKRLIVGGFEKVYEVSRDFRNEGVSRFHNPEFTQVEFYWAYVDYDVLMDFTQQLLAHIIKAVKGSLKFTFQGHLLDFTPPFERITFSQIIRKHTGIDIETVKSVKDLKSVLKLKKLKVDLDGVVGLGNSFDEVYKQLVRPNIIGPIFLTDYPSEMIALAKRKADDPSKIASFQLLACGTELLKAYNELNDPADQASRWLEEQGLADQGLETAMQFDHDYVRALEYGMPPTAGWGMGIDRLTQFLTDQSTIKDVILFPALRTDDQVIKNDTLIVGQTVSVKPHPMADKLKIWQVKADKTYSIICSCSNLKVGDLVVVAKEGAVVPAPDNQTNHIKPTKMRGVLSEAMMCSPLELSISKDHTCIHVLDKKYKQYLGKPITGLNING